MKREDTLGCQSFIIALEPDTPYAHALCSRGSVASMSAFHTLLDTSTIYQERTDRKDQRRG